MQRLTNKTTISARGIRAMAGKNRAKAIAYLRTSSNANVGEDKDSDKRQRAAIDAFAKRAGRSRSRQFDVCPRSRAAATLSLSTSATIDAIADKKRSRRGESCCASLMVPR
jgi:hypothetical protein